MLRVCTMVADQKRQVTQSRPTRTKSTRKLFPFVVVVVVTVVYLTCGWLYQSGLGAAYMHVCECRVTKSLMAVSNLCNM